jgi:hypothetical protein
MAISSLLACLRPSCPVDGAQLNLTAGDDTRSWSRINFDCYNHYLYTGDLSALEEPYPRLLRFAEYLQSILDATVFYRLRILASLRSGSITTPTGSSVINNVLLIFMPLQCSFMLSLLFAVR